MVAVGSSRSRGKVLVVDDSEIILEATALLLQEAGYEAVTLDSPFEIVNTARHHGPDLILLDVKMPALTGNKALELSRRFELLDDAVVVLHSDRDEEELKGLCRQCGADGYLIKTDDQDAFVRQVERWVAVAKGRKRKG